MEDKVESISRKQVAMERIAERIEKHGPINITDEEIEKAIEDGVWEKYGWGLERKKE